jgi:hypothetical protein
MRGKTSEVVYTAGQALTHSRRRLGLRRALPPMGVGSHLRSNDTAEATTSSTPRWRSPILEASDGLNIRQHPQLGADRLLPIH